MQESWQLEPIHISMLTTLLVLLAAGLIARTRAREEVGRRASSALSRSAQSLESSWQDRANQFLERTVAMFSADERGSDSALRKQLVQAGYFSRHAAAIFATLKLGTAIVLPIAFLLVLPFLSLDLPIFMIVGAVMGLALFSLVFIPVALDFRIRSMQEKYRRAFPDMMDLLVICVESGQSLPAAIAQVSRELMQISPQLGFNLHLVSLELRAGSTLSMSLLNLHGRLGLDEVKSLAVLLKQSEELGASIAGTLRVFSDEMREKRLVRAETKANMLPVKMTIPLGLFIFPVVMMVIMVPVVIRIKNTFV